MIKNNFFNRSTEKVARELIGKIIRRQYKGLWLSAKIIETEAYDIKDKASHASLGYTEKRKALFMSPGTIYMYYSRGDDSMNISCRGKGSAVLIKSGIPYVEQDTPKNMIRMMQKLNPVKKSNKIREPEKLCSGQTLLCKSLNITVREWDQQQFDPKQFYIEDSDYFPEKIIQTRRLGIPEDRDAHLLCRFIDHQHATHCTSNPLTKRGWRAEEDYVVSVQD